MKEKGFSSVNRKLLRARYFLEQMKQERLVTDGWLANLDGFFFEIISSKDFFLQAVNDQCKLNLTKRQATKTEKLMRELENKGYYAASKSIRVIDTDLKNETSWLFRLNNYRNSATHREITNVLIEVNIGSGTPNQVHLYKDPDDESKGFDDVDIRDYCFQSFDKMSQYLIERIKETV